MTNDQIICISVHPWDHPFQTSRHHLAAELARRNTVLFVDPPLNVVSAARTRQTPETRDRLAAWTGRRPALRHVRDGLHVLTVPPIVPFGKIRQRWLSDAVVAANLVPFRAAVRRAASALGFQRPLLWLSFSPVFGRGVLGRLDERLSLYHCTDETATEPRAPVFSAAIERDLLGRVDLVICSSDELKRTKGGYNPFTFTVPNAADVDLFAQALDPATVVPADLAAIPGPRVGFVGVLDFRVDQALLAACAAARPDLQWVLIGPVHGQWFDQAALARFPNVHFLGLQPRAALPGYLAGLDVATIPFVLDRHTSAIYPLKLHEYLAAGRPVAATPLPSLAALAEPLVGHLHLGAGTDGFLAAVDAALAVRDQGRVARLAIARQNAWPDRAADIGALIEERLTALAPEPRTTLEMSRP
ncbi:MAG: glycosyltransferase [Chloroflexi bacterium]|nr:glycosyltransferase [Chloroflexota bacterium]